MQTKTAILAALAAATLGTAAFVTPSVAQDARGGARIGFETLDIDNSGAITADELDQLAARRFAQLDANGDGVVSAEELTAHAEARAQQREKDRRAGRSAQMIERLDRNGDGVLSLDEMSSQGKRGGDLIERADTDGDGAISESEFEIAMEKKRHGGKRGGPGRGGDRG
jgi:Ca2+-binding EF-hand superfamily protein